MKSTRRTLRKLAGHALILLSLSTTNLSAANYPTRPITLVVPFGAGGTTDVFARMLADGLKAQLKTPVVIENRPGGGMAIGAGSVARAEKDGYTLLLAPAASVTLNEVVNPGLSYRGSDLAPIALLAVVPQVLTVRGDIPPRTVKALGDYAKARPGEVTVGNGGANTLTQIMAKVLEQDLDVKFNHIPFNGSSAARASMLANQIDAAMDVVTGLTDLERAGKAYPLGILAHRRHPTLPDVKTFVELGFSRMNKEGWFGLMAPKGTPQDIVEQLHAAAAHIMRDPDVVQRITAIGLQDRYGSTEEFTRVLKDDLAAWNEFVAQNPIPK